MVQIEATSRCNLSCPSCSYSKEGTAGQHLTPENLRSILDSFPKRPEKVLLSGIGEPLLNPRFFELTDMLAQRNIRCSFFTNGTVLRPEFRREILSRNHIYAVSISCDGARKETFEALRRGANFEKWKEGVGQFIAEAKQRPEPLKVTALVLVGSRNLAELPEIIRFVASLGFESASLLEPIPVDEEAASLCLGADQVSNLLKGELFGLARELKFRVDWCLRRPGRPPDAFVRCVMPWEYIFIRANGNVAPCCAVFGSDKGVVMGNIFRQPFKEIWRGEPFREFRRTCASGTNSLCRICPYY